MNIFKSLAIIILFFLFISCDSQKTEQELSSNLNSSFVLKDSIVVDYLGDLQITDYDEERKAYLSLDLSSNSIIQFDHKGNILFNPIKTGEGPDFVNGAIYSLSYSGKESVIVQTRSALYQLNFQGEILKKIKLPDGSLYSNMRLKNIVLGNKVLLLHDNNTDVRPIYRDYFKEVKHITVVDLETEKISYEISFEEGSFYKNDNYYYRISCPTISLNRKDSLLNIIYPFEKKIYQYDIGKGYLLQNVFNTNPKHFKEPERAEYGNEFPFIMNSLAYDSYYLNIYNNAKYILLEYHTGIPKSLKAPQSLPVLNDLLIDHNNRYYQIFDNGEKIGSDILRPEGMMDLRYFHKNNVAVFQLDKRKAERNYEVFYLYEIDL